MIARDKDDLHVRVFDPNLVVKPSADRVFDLLVAVRLANAKPQSIDRFAPKNVFGRILNANIRFSNGPAMLAYAGR